jgi:hypothetical protein
MKNSNLLVIFLSLMSIICSAVLAKQGLCEIGANKEFKEIDFSLADLITSYIENGREFQLEAFRLAKNSESTNH